MHAIVKDNCIGCGLCVNTCPEVFSMEGTQAVAIEAPVPEDVASDAQAGRDGCPVNAIDITE